MKAKTKPGQGEDADPVRALSDSTIRQTYTVLRAGLDGAVRDGLLARNPAALVKRPGVERSEARHLDARRCRRGPPGRQGVAVLPGAGADRGDRAAQGRGVRRCGGISVVNLDAGWLKVRSTVGRVGGSLVFSEPKTEGHAERCRCPPPSWRCCVSTGRPGRGAAARGESVARYGLVFTNELGGPVAAQPAAGDRGRGEGRRCRGRRRAHPAPQRGGRLAGGGVHIKAVADLLGHSIHRDHRRRLRAHLRRHGAGGGGRVERDC